MSLIIIEMSNIVLNTIKTFFFEHCDEFMSESEMKIYSVIDTFKLSVERGDNSFITVEWNYTPFLLNQTIRNRKTSL
jgi:hypothetical protein